MLITTEGITAFATCDSYVGMKVNNYSLYCTVLTTDMKAVDIDEVEELTPDKYVLKVAGFTFPKNEDIADKTLVIPSTYESGAKVIGIYPGLGGTFFTSVNKVSTVENLVCSDYEAKVYMSGYVNFKSLKKVTLGKYTKSFRGLLQNKKGQYFAKKYRIVVPSDAEYLKTVDGALYSKNGKVLYAARYSNNWTKMTISKNTETIVKYAFQGLSNKIVKIKGNVTTIQKGAFKFAKNITIKVPKARVAKYRKLIKKSGAPSSITVKGY